MSTIEVVEVARADMARFVATSAGFWGEVADEGSATVHEALDLAVLGRLDGEDVGGAAVIDFQLTLPGGARVAMDGVTWVAVSPAARRRGVLRAMMDHLLEQARARGVGLLGLGASESMIYRRFGYGVASHAGSATIDTAHAALRLAFTDAGRVHMQDLGDEALGVWRGVESARADRVGAIGRSEASWRRVLVTAPPRDGMGALQVAVHRDGSGVVDGYVNYRMEYRWPDEISDGVVHVSALSALTLTAHVALWQHVLAMDLMEHLRMERIALDDPIRHLLLDPRRLRVTARDDLHLRVADVVAVLQARRYCREDAVVLEVRDAAAADIAGRYRVEGGLEGASVSRTSAAADVVLDAPSLASLVLGDVSLAELYAAGLVEEVRQGAVRRASAMFSWSPRPWVTYMF